MVKFSYRGKFLHFLLYKQTRSVQDNNDHCTEYKNISNPKTLAVEELGILTWYAQIFYIVMVK